VLAGIFSSRSELQGVAAAHQPRVCTNISHGWAEGFAIFATAVAIPERHVRIETTIAISLSWRTYQGVSLYRIFSINSIICIRAFWRASGFLALRNSSTMIAILSPTILSSSRSNWRTRASTSMARVSVSFCLDLAPKSRRVASSSIRLPLFESHFLMASPRGNAARATTIPVSFRIPGT